MPEDDFQYKPLNSSVRPKPSRFKNFPRFKLPDLKTGGKWDIKKILLWIGIAFAGLVALGVISFAALIAVISIGLPSVHDLDNLYVAQSTTIYDREGNVLYVKFGGENRQYVPYDQISNHIINATVAIEDDQFWTHSGFDLVGITRAFINNLTGGSQQGGSTITQQYIKNAFLSSEKTYTRKLKELILSVQLEQAYSKEEILELYLNKIPYGNNAFGVEKAAEVYFGKDAKDLNLAESVILASLPKAPSYYNPYGPHRYSELATTISHDEIKKRNIKSEADLFDNEFLQGLIGKEVALDEENSIYIQGRTDLVLKTMVKLNYITEEEKDKALKELKTLEFTEHRDQMLAEHFVFHVLEELEAKYGKEIVEQGGLQVYTTLDPKLQEYAQTAVNEQAPINKERFNAKNAALTALDPKTGQILAMIGSVDYYSDEIDGAVNIATQYRQPGSSFKPIVYAKAFYNRYAPSSVVFDTKTRFGSSAFPKNYDGTFRGPMSIRQALGQSRNIPAIKAYYLAGEQEGVIDLAQKMGINFLNPSLEYGWPLALGSGEVRQIDMASAFGTFANGGVRHKPVSILKVTNSQGEILEEWKESEGEEVLDPEIAYLITDILSDTSVNLGPALNVAGHKTAVKTGTSTNNKDLPNDLWTIGYTPSLATAVWVGNNKTQEGDYLTYNADGYNAATPIWNKFMTNALKDTPSEEFEVPEGIKHEKVNRLTGRLPGPNTPDYLIVDEVFASFSVPTEVDDSYNIVKIDSRNNKLANEFCPEKFTEEKGFITLRDIAPFPEWQEGADAWMAENAAKLFGGETPDAESVARFGDVVIGLPPTSVSELCTEERLEEKPDITIKSPRENELFEIGDTLEVEVKVESVNDTDYVEYYLDNTFKYKTSDKPYTGIIRLPKNEEEGGRHEITVKAFDKYGYSSEEVIEILTSADAEKSGKKTGDDEDNTEDTTPADSEELPNTSDNTTPEDDIPVPDEPADLPPPAPDETNDPALHETDDPFTEATI